MPLITRANCQSENFTITNHNIYYTKKQLISHQHTPAPTNKIKPKSYKNKNNIRGVGMGVEEKKQEKKRNVRMQGKKGKIIKRIKNHNW